MLCNDSMLILKLLVFIDLLYVGYLNFSVFYNLGKNNGKKADPLSEASRGSGPRS